MIRSYLPRTAMYKMSAAAARQMYQTRNKADKNVPFKKYILDIINNESGLLYLVTKLELD